MRSKSYWERRALDTEAEINRGASRTVAAVKAAYSKAVADIEADIKRMFERFAKDGGLTALEARQILTRRETGKHIQRLKKIVDGVEDPKIRARMLSRINAPAYAARITRLEALKEQIYIECKRLADVEIALTRDGYAGAMTESYYRTTFDVQQGMGFAFNFAALPSGAVEATLKERWSGKNFSERVWRNTDTLAGMAEKIVTSGVLAGKSVRRMTDELENLADVARNAAERLIRTEVNYFYGQGALESYRQCGLVQYRFLATLDLRTSLICRRLDGQIFNVEDAKPGENCNPMHPRCRSTTVAVIDSEEERALKQRVAKDPVTGKNIHVPQDMTYEQWYDKFVAGNPRAATEEKKIKNLSSDRRQYERFGKILGKDAPKTFAKFQDLKYNDNNEWAAAKGFLKYKSVHPSAERRHYDIYTDLKRHGIDRGIVLPPRHVNAYILPDPKGRDRYHIMKRMNERQITDDDVRSYISDAKVMFNQWGGKRRVYYSDNGVTVAALHGDEWYAKTVWSKHDFDAESEIIMEVINKHAGS